MTTRENLKKAYNFIKAQLLRLYTWATNKLSAYLPKLPLQQESLPPIHVVPETNKCPPVPDNLPLAMFGVAALAFGFAAYQRRAEWPQLPQNASNLFNTLKARFTC